MDRGVRSLRPPGASCYTRLGEIIAREAEQLAELEVRDGGKLAREMVGQMRSLPEYYFYYGGLADKLQGDVIPVDKPNYLVYTRHEPVGVVGAITPWNSPLLLLTWKLAAGLAAGCTFVVKPSDHTPTSTLAFAKLFAEAGFPPGVINVVTGWGPETGAALASHPGVDKIAFTGSTATGIQVGKAAIENMTRFSLELGGKSAQVVFADADLDAAANGVIAGVFAATGQTCMAGSRLLVEQSVADALVDKIVARAATIKLGDPKDPATEMGPVSNQPQYEKVLSHFASAREQGATIAYGGEPATDLGGYFVKPTVLTGVDPSMRAVAEEIFGPVLGGDDLLRRGRGRRRGQRHRVRTGRGGVDQGRPPCAPGGRQAAGRHGLDQRVPRCRAACSVRRRRLQRHRPGERHRRRQRLHRDQGGVGGAVRGHPRPVHARLTSIESTGVQMTLDLTAADKVLAGLRPFPVAVTTIDGGFG